MRRNHNAYCHINSAWAMLIHEPLGSMPAYAVRSQQSSTKAGGLMGPAQGAQHNLAPRPQLSFGKICKYVHTLLDRKYYPHNPRFN